VCVQPSGLEGGRSGRVQRSQNGVLARRNLRQEGGLQRQEGLRREGKQRRPRSVSLEVTMREAGDLVLSGVVCRIGSGVQKILNHQGGRW